MPQWPFPPFHAAAHESHWQTNTFTDHWLWVYAPSCHHLLTVMFKITIKKSVSKSHQSNNIHTSCQHSKRSSPVMHLTAKRILLYLRTSHPPHTPAGKYDPKCELVKTRLCIACLQQADAHFNYATLSPPNDHLLSRHFPTLTNVHQERHKGICCTMLLGQVVSGGAERPAL